MKQFTYTITEPVGLHARPAGMLAKIAKTLNSEVTLQKTDGAPVSAKLLMRLLCMGVKTGDSVTVTISGGDESQNYDCMKRFFQEHL